MVIFDIATVDLDPEVVIDGARAALIANATIAPLVTKAGDDPKLARIVSEVGKRGMETPFITLALTGTVYLGTYGRPMISTLLDVGVYDDNWSLAVVRQIVKASLLALVVQPWTIEGMTLNTASMEVAGTGFRNASTVLPDGVTMRRGRQFTVGIIATKNG